MSAPAAPARVAGAAPGRDDVPERSTAASSSEVLRLVARYDEDARTYRDVWGPVLLPAGRRLLRELGGRQVERVLDLGTGAGSLSGDLAQLFPGATVLGVDRSPGMLALAPHGMRRAVMDARRLGVAAHSVDLVVSAFVLFLLERPEEALHEVKRVLRPGGRLGAITWESTLESSAIDLWNGLLDEAVPEEEPSLTSQHVEETNTPEKMTGLLRRAGLVAVHAWSEELVHAFSVEGLLALRSGMGASRRRLACLPAREREAFLRNARTRLGKLELRSLVARGRMIFATACAPVVR